jgi:hypothetical protein
MYQMRLFSVIATATSISTLLVTAAPVNAFWGGKAEQQKKQILGTWECDYIRNGKKYTADENMFSFRRGGSLRTSTRIGNSRLSMYSGWKIPNESELIFPAGGEAEKENLSTGKTVSEKISGTMHNTILVLTDSRLVFEREGGGEEYRCRR